MGRHIGHHIRTVITKVHRAAIMGVVTLMETVFLIDTTDVLEIHIATNCLSQQGARSDEGPAAE